MSLKAPTFHIFRELLNLQSCKERRRRNRRQKMKGIRIWEGMKRALEKGQFMGRDKNRQRMGQLNGENKMKTGGESMKE